MKPYKLAELKENTMYRCLLSDRPVIVVAVYTTHQPKEATSVIAYVYNSTQGYVESYIVYDGMLTDYAK